MLSGWLGLVVEGLLWLLVLVLIVLGVWGLVAGCYWVWDNTGFGVWWSNIGG